MTAVHIDSDRLLVLAGAPDSGVADEAAHLADCAECQLELRLLGAARRLGAARVPSLSSDRVLAAVRARLAQPDDHPKPSAFPRPARWVVGLAAAAALALVVRFTVLPGANPVAGAPVQAAVTSSLFHELDDLSAPELEAVLSTLTANSERMPAVDATPFGDLTTSDLERVLRSMEE